MFLKESCRALIRSHDLFQPWVSRPKNALSFTFLWEGKDLLSGLCKISMWWRNIPQNLWKQWWDRLTGNGLWSNEQIAVLPEKMSQTPEELLILNNSVWQSMYVLCKAAPGLYDVILNVLIFSTSQYFTLNTTHFAFNSIQKRCFLLPLREPEPKRDRVFCISAL